MASPPVISAPTLVTSTNQVACNTASSPCSTTPPSSPQKDDWHFKYLEAKANYRKLKSQMREQAKKSRQLIVAVKNKLQEEENEKIKVNKHFANLLKSVCNHRVFIMTNRSSGPNDYHLLWGFFPKTFYQSNYVLRLLNYINQMLFQIWLTIFFMLIITNV